MEAFMLPVNEMENQLHCLSLTKAYNHGQILTHIGPMARLVKYCS